MEVGGIGVGNIPGLSNLNTVKDKVSDESFEARLKKAMDEQDAKELKKVCKEFEGILLKMMYKQMKATIPKSDLIPSDAARDVFESMLDDELMEEASKGTGYGLADLLYKQLSRKFDSIYTLTDKGE